jgi:hypothetical protein
MGIKSGLIRAVKDASQISFFLGRNCAGEGGGTAKRAMELSKSTKREWIAQSRAGPDAGRCGGSARCAVNEGIRKESDWRKGRERTEESEVVASH